MSPAIDRARVGGSEFTHCRLMSRASGEPTVIIDQYHPGRTPRTPFSHHEIEIVDARPGGEAVDSHARISRRNQAIRQGLRCRDTARENFGFPGGAG